MARRYALIGIVALVIWLAAIANGSPVLAQAGSTGGTIGNTNKSLSGGEDTEPHRKPNREAPIRHRSTTEKSTGSACQKIVGTWAWHYISGTTETVFSPNGSGRSNIGLTNSWTCTGRIATVIWSHGYVDRLTISRDGSSLSITNNKGESFSATRK
jgi:hypothetical protein